MATGRVRTTVTMREAIRICLRREHLRRTVRIALVVGVILTLINQADVVIRGDATAITWVKAAGNFLVPFIVSNLGLLAGKWAERDPDPRDRPPAPT
ncbi:MAG: nitrate/nitrite transporter NrtS [Microbacterium sp.]|uniref:nitrate/nitrite transporter NrtS n=1 Tax=Microbacterium sp. TaxID=51671 RepID=UPI003D6F8143